MDRPDWVPPTIDIEQPSAARMYDYFLGGSHNFAIDRELANRVLEIGPNAPMVAQLNRAFLRRAVRYLVDHGVRQFIDLGSGIPTAGNVHEIAQAIEPATRVVYVDLDPVAVAHCRYLLAGNPTVAALQDDLRRPDRIMDSPEVGKLIDPTEPAALMMVSVLHFIQDEEDPAGIVERFRQRLAPGSYLVISHATQESRPSEAANATKLYARTGTPLRLRTRAEVARLFGGFDLVEPGLVWLPEWHPDAPDEVGTPQRASGYVGVGRLG
jgi:hypothetical protein